MKKVKNTNTDSKIIEVTIKTNGEAVDLINDLTESLQRLDEQINLVMDRTGQLIANLIDTNVILPGALFVSEESSDVIMFVGVEEKTTYDNNGFIQKNKVYNWLVNEVMQSISPGEIVRHATFQTNGRIK